MADPNTPRSGSAEDHLTGRLLVDRYRLNTRIAAGGMAEVWEATDQTLARRVAVKLLHAHLATDDSFIQRFRAEAVAAARLAHPSIVSVYDTFSVDGLEAIVMELVVGTTMRADLDAHGPMRLDAALAIGSQVADALGTAHAAGLVHRDVKPANILLAADGRVLVADFGIAKAVEGKDLTTAGSMIGTAKYLAPEQVEGGAIDGRADLYSLGVVLYEALTGTPPFVADTDASTALARLHRDPIPPRQLRADIPQAVEQVVMQALARDRDGRFANAAAMRTALVSAGQVPRAQRVPANPPTSGRSPLAPVAVPQPAPVPTRHPGPFPAATEAPSMARRSRGWLVVVVLVTLLATAGWFAVNNSTQPAAQGQPLAVTSASSFDPQGDNGTERDDLLPNAIDGDAATSWQSERYGDPKAMNGKDGVGLVLNLDGEHQLDQLDVIAPEGGWSAQIYVGTGAKPVALSDWGPAITSVASAESGVTRFSLGGQRGDIVLIWFTDMAPSGRMTVADATVRGT